MLNHLKTVLVIQLSMIIFGMMSADAVAQDQGTSDFSKVMTEIENHEIYIYDILKDTNWNKFNITDESFKELQEIYETEKSEGKKNLTKK